MDFDEWESEFDPQARDRAACINRTLSDAERHADQHSGNATEFTSTPTRRWQKRWKR